MHPVLQRNLFLVKEQVGMFKAASNYDVYDPTTGQVLLLCREERIGIITKLLRFTDYKQLTPFHVDVRTPDGHDVLSVKRGVSLLRSKVSVLDGNDAVVGGFRQKLFSIGGAFDVLDTSGQTLCKLKGKWTSWDFRFLAGNNELALVSKKWAGLGKEFFTSADNYVLKISEDVPPDHPVRLLILAAVLCIDKVLKE